MDITKLFRRSKRNATALEQLRNLRDFINTVGYYLGFDVLRSDFALNKKSIGLIMILVSCIITELYTLYYFMSNVLKQLQTICICAYTIVVGGVMHHKVLFRY